MSRHLPHDPTASAGSETPTPEVLARRRFVRGVFAAPAVMTVCSGSAYAAAVSATCLVRAQRADPVGVSAYSTALDSTYLRVRVHELNGVKYVRYGDLTMIGSQGVASPVPGNVGLDDYLELNDTGGLTGNVLRTQRSTAAAPGATSNAVVVRFDERGYVVGTGTHGSLGALASMACLMSVTP